MNARRIVVICCGIGMSWRSPLGLRSLWPLCSAIRTQVEP